MNTATKVDRPAVTTDGDLRRRQYCSGWPHCGNICYVGDPVNACLPNSEEVVAIGDANPRGDFIVALAALRSANLAFVAEVRRCHGEKPLGSPIKKVEYRVSDGSIAVIDDNGGLVTFSGVLGEDQ